MSKEKDSKKGKLFHGLIPGWLDYPGITLALEQPKANAEVTGGCGDDPSPGAIVENSGNAAGFIGNPNKTPALSEIHTYSIGTWDSQPVTTDQDLMASKAPEWHDALKASAKPWSRKRPEVYVDKYAPGLKDGLLVDINQDKESPDLES
jgi:hypothetical protein